MSREPAMQLCPFDRTTPASMPFTALVISASANTICGDLPPSSRVAGLRPLAAVSATAMPPASDPVKVTFLTLGCATSASPSSAPRPVTTFSTPAGSPARWASSANSRVDTDACSDGLTTTVFPAARAGASFQAAIMRGEFHGVMAATTP